MFAAAGLLPCLRVYTISWKMPQGLISGSQRGVSFCIYLPAKQPLTLRHSSQCRGGRRVVLPVLGQRQLGQCWPLSLPSLPFSQVDRSTSWDVAGRVGNLRQRVATGASGARAAGSSGALGLEVTPSLCSGRSALGTATSCMSHLCRL